MHAQTKTLYVISGPGGSGKTTLARSIVQRCGGMHFLEGDRYDDVETALRQGAQCVVIDGVRPLPGVRGWSVVKLARQLDYRVIPIDMSGKPTQAWRYYWPEVVGDHKGMLAETAADTPEPAPQRNCYPELWPNLIADLQQRLDPQAPGVSELLRLAASRHAFGVAKYDTGLQPFNGRDARVDAIQEALDLMIYLYQLQYEAACRNDARVYALCQPLLVQAVDMAIALVQVGEVP